MSDRTPGWYWTRWIVDGPWLPVRWYCSHDVDGFWVTRSVEEHPTEVGRFIPLPGEPDEATVERMIEAIRPHMPNHRFDHLRNVSIAAIGLGMQARDTVIEEVAQHFAGVPKNDDWWLRDDIVAEIRALASPEAEGGVISLEAIDGPSPTEPEKPAEREVPMEKQMSGREPDEATVERAARAICAAAFDRGVYDETTVGIGDPATVDDLWEIHKAEACAALAAIGSGTQRREALDWRAEVERFIDEYASDPSLNSKEIIEKRRAAVNRLRILLDKTDLASSEKPDRKTK